MAGKVLIAYGTRYGATQSTSEEIAKVLRETGLEVKTADVNKEKVKDISGYDLVIIGSGMQMGKWTKAPESFMAKHRKELATKKVAIFVSSGAEAFLVNENKTDESANNRKLNLDDKAAKYNLQPISMTMFGGVWDYNKMNFLFKNTLVSFKPRLEAAGVKEMQPGIFDTRNWDEIREWAKELASKMA